MRPESPGLKELQEYSAEKNVEVINGLDFYIQSHYWDIKVKKLTKKGRKL